jgi:hypothetical protein
MDFGYSNIRQSSGNGLTNYLFYGLLIVFAAIIILVIIHFTYAPIFGGTGSVLSGDGGIVKWEDESSSTHEDVSSNMCATSYYNFSLCFDIILDGTETYGSNQVILSQVSPLGTGPNFQFYLDASKNDLCFEVYTMENGKPGTAYINLINMPIRKEFTIGFILSDKFMETYVNGALYQTNVFPVPARLKESTQNLVFRDGLKTSSAAPARIKRLRLWGEIVGPDVMRAYASSVSPSFKLESEDIGEGVCG